MPMNSYSVPLRQLVDEFNLTISYEATNYDKVQLMVEEVMRPGLQLWLAAQATRNPAQATSPPTALRQIPLAAWMLTPSSLPRCIP